MQVELKHTLTVDRESWFIRFYLWLWKGSERDINFCKLFWGYVFAIPALILKLIFKPLDLIFAPVVRRSIARREARWEEELLADPRSAEPKKPSRTQGFLQGVSNLASKVVYAIQRVWYFVSSHKRLSRVLLAAAVVLGALASLGLIGFGIYLIVNDLSVLLYIGICLGVVLIGTAVATLLIYVCSSSVVQKFLRRLGLTAKGGTLGFFNVMKLGYIAVKSNTCPKIEVKP